jgi:hypothetical protein
MNEENNFLLNEVKAAIAVQHNEHSSQHDRQRAFEYCNNVKETAEWPLCFFLMHQQNSSFERHFGGKI